MMGSISLGVKLRVKKESYLVFLALLTWYHSLSTLKKALFGDYTYEMSRLQQLNDSG